MSWESLSSPLGLTAIAAVVSLILFVSGYLLLDMWRKRGPADTDLERLLDEWVMAAIVSAYKVSERATDELGHRLRGADKAALARLLYSALPDRIGSVDMGRLKSLISEEQFAVYVQEAFNRAMAYYDACGEVLDKRFEEWVQGRDAMADTDILG